MACVVRVRDRLSCPSRAAAPAVLRVPRVSPCGPLDRVTRHFSVFNGYSRHGKAGIRFMLSTIPLAHYNYAHRPTVGSGNYTLPGRRLKNWSSKRSHDKRLMSWIRKCDNGSIVALWRTPGKIERKCFGERTTPISQSEVDVCNHFSYRQLNEARPLINGIKRRLINQMSSLCRTGFAESTNRSSGAVVGAAERTYSRGSYADRGCVRRMIG